MSMKVLIKKNEKNTSFFEILRNILPKPKDIYGAKDVYVMEYIYVPKDVYVLYLRMFMYCT